MPPNDRLKLSNGWTNRKDGLSQRDPLHIYGPTLPPDPSRLADFRVFCVTELVRRLLSGQGRQLQMVEQPDRADLVVSLADDEVVGKVKATRGVWLRVTPAAGTNEVAIGPDEARYLMYSMPPAGVIQWNAGAVAGARAAFSRLRDYANRLQAEAGNQETKTAEEGLSEWRSRFYDQLFDDLNTPRALAVLWTMLQSDLPDGAKFTLLAEFSRVFGLEKGLNLPASPRSLAASSNSNGHTQMPGPPKPPPLPASTRDWQKQPKVRPVSGLEGKAGPPPKSKAGLPPSEPPPERRRIIQSRDVRSHLNEPDRFDFTVSLVAYHNLPRLRTTVESLLYYVTRSSRSVEIVVAEMHGDDETADYLEVKAAQVANFRVIYARQNLGEAAGRNIAFRQGRGRFLLLVDAGLNFLGDIFERLWPVLTAHNDLALYSSAALTLERAGEQLTGFKGAQAVPDTVEALAGSLLCLPRRAIEPVGFMDEHFRIPYALDLDYSFAFKDKGLSLRLLPPLTDLVEGLDGPRPLYDLTPEQAERQRQKNWQLFLRSWQD